MTAKKKGGKPTVTKSPPAPNEIQGYCVKCKAKRAMKNPKPETLKNGSKAVRGTCGVCGTSIFKMGG